MGSITPKVWEPLQGTSTLLSIVVSGALLVYAEQFIEAK